MEADLARFSCLLSERDGERLWDFLLTDLSLDRLRDPRSDLTLDLLLDLLLERDLRVSERERDLLLLERLRDLRLFERDFSGDLERDFLPDLERDLRPDLECDRRLLRDRELQNKPNKKQQQEE